MSYLPLFISTKGRKILVVGGGSVALHKLRTITRFTKDVTVLAPSVLPQIRRLGVTVVKACYSRKRLSGASLVYTCTDDPSVNRAVCADARKTGILVNAADDKASSDFISPAVYKRGKMVVCVSSQGTDVRKAVRLRDRIAKELDGDKRTRTGS